MSEDKPVFENESEENEHFDNPEYRDNMLNKKKRISKKMKWIFFILLFILIIVFGVYMALVISGLPKLQELENPKYSLTTLIISSENEVIDQLCYQNRTMISIDSIPRYLINALIATEDHRFYQHWGVDVLRFIKSRVKNLWHLREGASTITQQLARHLYLSRELSLTRKLREWITALQIERTYTKNEILSLYLNLMYLGKGAYGVEAATQAYFDKPVSQLSLSESAFLVGILKGPENYDPDEYPQRAMDRRNLVLKQMLKLNFINEKTYNQTYDEPIVTKVAVQSSGIAPHFTEMIRQQLQKDPRLQGYDIYRDGLRIFTTLDTRMQTAANRAVEEHLEIIQKQFNSTWNWKNNVKLLAETVKKEALRTNLYRAQSTEEEKRKALDYLANDSKFIDSVKNLLTTIQAGVVVIDPINGHIKALVGNTNYKQFRYGLNHVTQIKRQPGSSFKPFIYLAAIENGYSPATILSNERVSIPDGAGKIWSPANSDGVYGGSLSLRQGLKNSVNTIAARAISELTSPREVIKWAHQLGIKSSLPEVYSLALGTCEVSPLEITAAFGCFPTEGIYSEPIAVTKVEDKNGKLIFQNRSASYEALKKESAYILTSMLEDVVNGGTATSAIRNHYSFPAAGKTGTTQGMADAWFIGFTKQLVAGVWVGFDDLKVKFTSMVYGQGGRAAAPIWGRMMKYIYSDPNIKQLKPLQFNTPDGLERIMICSETGKIAGPTCTHVTEELILDSRRPDLCDGEHFKEEIQTQNTNVSKPAIGF
jgi:penicillin-binding protein 1A